MFMTKFWPSTTGKSKLLQVGTQWPQEGHMSCGLKMYHNKYIDGCVDWI